MTKDLRLKIYPALIGVLSVGLVISLLGQFNKTTWNDDDMAPPVVTELPPPAPVPTSTDSATPSPTASIVPSPVPPPTAAVGVGQLRVSNQTVYPLRVALLRQADPTTASATGEPGFYNATAHWDFAPQEGSEQGLLLSLPDDALALKDGDIVVAFAQDGSRAYWGPYVLGRTALPTWNADTGEWDLVLKP